jgi:2-polyprenyl-3-methyl-5-hydroxy-6-metoxy-1,4-benzoquinol methylase
MTFKCIFCKKKKHKKIEENIKDYEFGVPGRYSYLQCTHCELISLSPFPSLDCLKNFYPNNYISYLENSKKKGVIYYILEKIYNFIYLKKLKKEIKINSNLLDVGGGNGDFLINISDSNSKLYSIDFNKKVCEVAKKKGINSFCGFFLDYYNDKKFDYIFMNHYLEHVIDPMQELKKAYKILKKDGRIIGVMPNFYSYDQKIFRKYWGGNHVPRHTYQYSPKVLKKMLQKSGFVNVEIKHDINPAHLVLSVQNLLYRNKQNLLVNGRSNIYNILLIIFFPINFVFKILNRSGIMTFSAAK